MDCKDCKNYKPKEWVTALPEPTHVPYFSYFLGKPQSYWMKLESEHQRTLKELEHIKSVVPTITTIWGKPLEYWTDLESKSLDLQVENKNLQYRIDKANNALNGLRNVLDGV
jgi:hypothetical protein